MAIDPMAARAFPAVGNVATVPVRVDVLAYAVPLQAKPLPKLPLINGVA